MASNPPENRTDDRSIDQLCGLLASEYRRGVLSTLAETTDGRATVETLVDRLATTGAETPETAGRSRRTVRIQLLHVHLPKLGDADLVEYDPDSGTVTYERSERVEALLNAVR